MNLMKKLLFFITISLFFFEKSFSENFDIYKKIEELYLLTENHPVSLYEVLKWIRFELGLSLDNLPISNRINGKKLRSEILPQLNFIFKHSSYKSGYLQMIEELDKTRKIRKNK